MTCARSAAGSKPTACRSSPFQIQDDPTVVEEQVDVVLRRAYRSDCPDVTRSSRLPSVAFLSRPAGPPCGGGGCQHLPGAPALLHAFGAAPLLGDDEQRAAVRAAEHAGETAAVTLHR